MKGMMVALLTVLTVISAATKLSAQTKEGKFVLWLDDALLEKLKTNPEGLIAAIDAELQGKITEVVIKYRAPELETTQQMGTTAQTVARPEFDSRTNNATNSAANPVPGFSTPRRDNGAFDAGQSGNQNQSSILSEPFRPSQRIQQTAGLSTPTTNQEWMPIGDNTDFVPVVRPNWIARQTQSIDQPQNATNNRNDFRDFLNDPSRTINQFSSTRREQQANAQLNQIAAENGFQANGARRQLPLNSTWDQNRGQIAQPSQTQQQSGQIPLYAQQTRQNQQQPFQPVQQQPFRPNYIEQQQPQQQTAGTQQIPNQQIVYQPYPYGNYLPIPYPSNQFPRRQADNFYQNSLAYDQAVETASLPNRRIAKRNEVRPTTTSRTSLTTTQIPGPNDPNVQQNSPGDMTSLANLTAKQQQDIIANANNYKRTNGFLLFMLLCSVGINVYLGLISRSFYTRYSELADELRETFTATM